MCKPRGAGHYLPANIERAIMSTNPIYASLEQAILLSEEHPEWVLLAPDYDLDWETPAWDEEFCGELWFH